MKRVALGASEPLKLARWARNLHPVPMAYRPIDHQLSRRPLKLENPGQHWMGRPFRGSGPTGRGNTLKPCSVWVRIPGAAPARVSQFGRGSGSRSRPVRVRIPPRAPSARSPIGRRHDAQTVGSVGSNPSARTTSTRSVPAEWSATSPENWDGYLMGRGFDSSALRQIRTAQTARLPCLPAKQCVPAGVFGSCPRLSAKPS